MKVIAIHGDYASGKILKRDMGSPSWVTHYIDWSDYIDAKISVKDIIREKEDLILIGYSRGADWASRICRKLEHSNRVKGLIVYEGLCDMSTFRFNGPILNIWNDRGRLKTRRGRESNERWVRCSTNYTAFTGKGRHISFGWRFPPYGHAWDKSLNEKILDWMRLNVGFS